MSAPERRPALAFALPPAEPGAAPGVTLSERLADVVEIAARRGVGRDALLAALVLDEHGLVLAPGRIMVLAPPSPPGAREASLAERLGASGAVVDQSSGFVVLSLEGPAVRDLLARACRLDLADAAFPRGMAARTIIAQVTTIVYRPPGADRFDLIVPLTLAASFATHLTHAGAAFGVRVAPASEYA